MPPAPEHRYERARVGWLSVTQLITWGSVFYTFALLMEPVERDLGLSRAQSSLAFSLALLAEGLLAYPVGRWIDRGHERAVMTGGSLAVALCLLAHSFITSIAQFYAVWLALGAALSATLYSPVFAVVTRRYPHDFRRAKVYDLSSLIEQDHLQIVSMGLFSPGYLNRSGSWTFDHVGEIWRCRSIDTAIPVLGWTFLLRDGREYVYCGAITDIACVERTACTFGSRLPTATSSRAKQQRRHVRQGEAEVGNGH